MWRGEKRMTLFHSTLFFQSKRKCVHIFFNFGSNFNLFDVWRTTKEREIRPSCMPEYTAWTVLLDNPWWQNYKTRFNDNDKTNIRYSPENIRWLNNTEGWFVCRDARMGQEQMKRLAGRKVEKSRSFYPLGKLTFLLRFTSYVQIPLKPSVNNKIAFSLISRLIGLPYRLLAYFCYQ